MRRRLDRENQARLRGAVRAARKRRDAAERVAYRRLLMRDPARAPMRRRYKLLLSGSSTRLSADTSSKVALAPLLHWCCCPTRCCARWSSSRTPRATAPARTRGQPTRWAPTTRSPGPTACPEQRPRSRGRPQRSRTCNAETHMQGTVVRGKMHMVEASLGEYAVGQSASRATAAYLLPQFWTHAW